MQYLNYHLFNYNILIFTKFNINHLSLNHLSFMSILSYSIQLFNPPITHHHYLLHLSMYTSLKIKYLQEVMFYFQTFYFLIKELPS